ncbi:MAG TPA: phosphopantetheine-binding protein, partial [Streptosporangiaceae bacterium]
VVPRSGDGRDAGDGGAGLAGELRAFAAGRLPGYMVPSAFVTLDRLPLNASGKLHRAALPTPDHGRPEPAALPGTATEHMVAQIWSDLLGVHPVGIHDNFFDLGGTSLLLLRLHAGLERAAGIKVSLVDLFRYPTVHRLAVFLDGLTSTEPPQRQAEGQAQGRLRRRSRLSRMSRSGSAAEEETRQ